jgi:hypothetical protein
MDFRENIYLANDAHAADMSQVSMHWYNNCMHFTWRPNYIFDTIADHKVGFSWITFREQRAPGTNISSVGIRREFRPLYMLIQERFRHNLVPKGRERFVQRTCCTLNAFHTHEMTLVMTGRFERQCTWRRKYVPPRIWAPNRESSVTIRVSKKMRIPFKRL